jgi:hypothetical protein
VAVGSELPQLGGYPFEVRYSDGSLVRARAAADVAAGAYVYFSHLFSAVEPDIAVVVADEADWPGNDLPYGLPFFRDDAGEIRPGIVVMPAGGGDFWIEMAQDLRDASPQGYAKLLATYPDGTGGLDLQPFFALITIHELGHAFEVLGDLRFPTFWLSEIFVNLALHAFVATRLPASLPTLEVLPTVGAGSRKLAARMRGEGYSTLEELQAHYPPGSDESMGPLNYVWFQYRWQRLAANVFEADGEDGLVRFWDCFHSRDRANDGATAASLAPLLTAEVSPTLGREVRDWR